MNYTKKFPAQFTSYDEFEAKLIENNAECAYQYTKMVLSLNLSSLRKCLV